MATPNYLAVLSRESTADLLLPLARQDRSTLVALLAKHKAHTLVLFRRTASNGWERLGEVRE